jgi:hypothetical protein
MDAEEVVLDLVIINEGIRRLNFSDQLQFFRTIEREYETEADNELGEFLNRVVWSFINYGENDELHRLLSDIVDDSGLDEEMLSAVCKHINGFLQTTQG